MKPSGCSHLHSKPSNSRKFLVIRHVDPGQVVYGGIAYTNSLLAQITNAFPDTRIEQIFVYGDLNKLKSPARKVLSILRSLFTRFPAKIEHFMSRQFESSLRMRLSSEQYDLVIFNGIDVLGYLTLVTQDQRTLYIAHNWESSLYRQQIKRYQSWPLLGYLLKRDLGKLEHIENAGIELIDRIVFISSEDADALGSHSLVRRSTVIGPTFPYPAYQGGMEGDSHPTEKIRLGFLGNLNWWPNREGVDWFLTEVFSRLSQTKFELHIFGPGSEAFGNESNIYGHGFVDDLEDVWNGIDCMIQPIRSGAGVNIKVAETLYNGIPMIGTHLSARGLSLEKDEAIVLLDDAVAWAEFIQCDTFPNFLCRRTSAKNQAQFSSKEAVGKLEKLLGKG